MYCRVEQPAHEPLYSLQSKERSRSKDIEQREGGKKGERGSGLYPVVGLNSGSSRINAETVIPVLLSSPAKVLAIPIRRLTSKSAIMNHNKIMWQSYV